MESLQQLQTNHGVPPQTMRNTLEQVVGGSLTLDLDRTSTADAISAGPEVSFEYTVEPARDEVARALLIPPGSQVCARRLWQRRGEQVVRYYEEFLPGRVVTGMFFERQICSQHAHTHDLLRRSGHRIARFEEIVEYRPPIEDEITLLDLDPLHPAPVARITRVTVNHRDRPLEVSYLVAPADRVTLRYTLPGSG